MYWLAANSFMKFNYQNLRTKKSAVPEGRALVAGSADRPYPLERLGGGVPYPDSPRQADASYSEKGHGHRPRQENGHPWQWLESRGNAQNQGTCHEEHDQDCRDHDQLHRNRQSDRFHRLCSFLSGLFGMATEPTWLDY